MCILCRLTVPLVDSDSYNQKWFVAASAGFPIFMLWYFGVLNLHFTFPVALVLGAVLGGVSYSFSAADKAPEWTLGLPFPVGAAFIACVGFMAAAMWIDTIAGKSFSCHQTVCQEAVPLPNDLLTIRRLYNFLVADSQQQPSPPPNHSRHTIQAGYMNLMYTTAVEQWNG